MNTKILNYKKDYASNGMQNSLYIWEKTNTHCKEEFLELPSFFMKKSIWIYLTRSDNFNKHLITSIPFQIVF